MQPRIRKSHARRSKRFKEVRFSCRGAAFEPSPAFQSRESGCVVVSVAERRLIPIIGINRRSATENGYALVDPALKSRAKLNRRCRDEEVLLYLFFKHHKPTAKVKSPLTRRRGRSSYFFI